MPALFTASQAAAVTGLSCRAVQKAIDAGLVPVKTIRHGKTKRRFLSEAALVCLHLESRGLALFPPATRKRLFGEIAASTVSQSVRPAPAVTIDLRYSRQTVARTLRRLRKAEAMVSVDPEVLSGTPVFRGTRVPVHQIALELEREASVDEVLDSYPSLTQEQVELAPIYAKAHPRVGRPPVQPWSDVKPRRVIRVLPSL